MNRLLACMWTVIAVALVFWASGCGPILTSQSLPPPGRTAFFDHNDDHYDLDLSQGVAIAISCYDDGPCKDVVIKTDDESIADVRGASGSKVESEPYAYRTLTPASIVIVGKAPGKTRIRVKTKGGSKTINVHVLAPPLVSAPSKVAL